MINLAIAKRGVRDTFDGRCSVQEDFLSAIPAGKVFFNQRSVQEGWMPALREGEVTLLFIYATLLKCAFTMLQVLHHCVELLDP